MEAYSLVKADKRIEECPGCGDPIEVGEEYRVVERAGIFCVKNCWDDSEEETDPLDLE